MCLEAVGQGPALIAEVAASKAAQAGLAQQQSDDQIGTDPFFVGRVC